MTRHRAIIALQWLSLLGIVALAWLVLRGWAGADDGSRRRLSVAIARVAVNEASLSRATPADVALIHQTTEAHGTTARARLRWLRRHSSCVLTNRPMSAAEQHGNCPLSRSLPTHRGPWPDAVPHRYQRRWEQAKRFAWLLVTGQRDLRPCPEQPTTWGGRVIDMRRALARGLRPLGCVDPATGELLSNEGFAR